MVDFGNLEAGRRDQHCGRAVGDNGKELDIGAHLGEHLELAEPVFSQSSATTASARTAHPNGHSRFSSSSTQPGPLSIVPRSKRRGLLGRLTIIPEVERPYEYGNGTKWAITAVVALAALASPVGSAIFYRRLSHS